MYFDYNVGNLILITLVLTHKHSKGPDLNISMAIDLLDLLRFQLVHPAGITIAMSS